MCIYIILHTYIKYKSPFHWKRSSSELAWPASRHQIRVHMAHIGHAVVSDGKYTCAGLKGLRQLEIDAWMHQDSALIRLKTWCTSSPMDP